VLENATERHTNMNRDIVVSVCCSTYNHERFIAQAIEGFLKQETTFPIEILIHDDASTDGTPDIIRRYTDKHANLIRPIYQVQNQYSKGVKIYATYLWPGARGKYIALCEGDDYWTDPLKLQKQVDFLEARPRYVLCYHKAVNFYEDGSRPTNYLPVAPHKHPMDINDLLGTGNTFATASVVFRNGLLSELPAWYYSMPVGDWPLYVLLAQQGDIGYLDEVMSAHRTHAGGMWAGRPPVDNLHGLVAACHLFASNLGPQYRRSVEAGLSRIYLRLSVAYANQGDIPKAKEYLKKSLAQCPFNRYIRMSHLAAASARLYTPRLYRVLKRAQGRSN